mmetsp:Transcript_37842/g.46048  ORF Transcript_37842/g.46048 Transcript_37842/m.46048 type:complete len:108 (-) Transcript_37842:170-493(-)
MVVTRVRGTAPTKFKEDVAIRETDEATDRYIGRSLWHNERTKRTKQTLRCLICNKMESAQLSNVRDHIRSHLCVKPYMCPTCGKDFTKALNCKKHQNKCIVANRGRN